MYSLKPKRDYMIESLRKAGMHAVKPEAGFFVIADFSKKGTSILVIATGMFLGISWNYMKVHWLMHIKSLSGVNYNDGSCDNEDIKFCKWMIKAKVCFRTYFIARVLLLKTWM